MKSSEILIKESCFEDFNSIMDVEEMASTMVFVLGHMDYYPRHGFIPDAKELGYEAPYPIPEEVKNAWMVQSLQSEGFPQKKGKIICADQMMKPEFWQE